MSYASSPWIQRSLALVREMKAPAPALDSGLAIVELVGLELRRPGRVLPQRPAAEGPQYRAMGRPLELIIEALHQGISELVGGAACFGWLLSSRYLAGARY